MKNKTILKVWKNNQGSYDIEQKKEENEYQKLRTILKCLNYMDKKDKIFLGLSFASTIGLALVAPFNVFFLQAPVLDLFIKTETPGNSYNLNRTAEVAAIKVFGYGYYIVGGITFIFGIIQIMASEIASRNIMAKIKTAYLSKLLSIEISWYDKSQEQFVSTVSHDLQKMVILFDSAMINLAETVLFFIFSSLACIIASWQIALLNIGMILIVMVIIYFMLEASKKSGKPWQEYLRKCTKITSEVLGNTRTVAAYGAEYKEIERYESTLKVAYACELKYSTFIAAGKAFNYFQLCICNMIAYYFCVRLYLSDDFDPGYLVVVLAHIHTIYTCTFMLNTIYDLNMATDSAHRVMNFLDTETSFGKSIEQGVEPNTFKPHISLRNVQFSYPTSLHEKVLNELTLEIEEGKVTAVIGNSGAGKSTIVSLISRLYDVTTGEIFVGGVDIKKLNVSWLRNQISVVEQEPMLFDTSIEENIRYGKTNATLEEIIEAAKTSYSHGFIEKLPSGYDSIVGESGIKLSGGQKQRIAIARAIIRKPKLLVLDEATSALDVNSEGIVQEALRNAMRDRTTLIIAHRMSTVKKADVIYAIKEGRVMEKGSHIELMELKGYYYSLAKTQELEEKDKVITLKKEIVPTEELIEETSEYVDDNLEVPVKTNIQWSSKKNLKIMVVWFLSILFGILMSVFLPAFFYIFSIFSQTFTYDKHEMNWIALTNIGYLFGLGTIVFFVVMLSVVMSTVANQLWLEKLQNKAFNKIVSMDISWFDKSGNSPSECLEILTNSPPIIASVTGDRATQVATFIFSLVFTLVYSFIISSSVTLEYFPVLITFMIINCLRLKSRDHDARSASLLTKSTKVATEYVQNIKTIQMLNCQKYVINHFKDILIRSKKAAFVSLVWYAAAYTYSKTAIRWSMGTLFIFGANIVMSGEVRGTLLIGVINALSMASNLAGPTLIMTSQYPAARQAIKQLYRIANTKPSLNILSDHRGKPEISGNINFKDVTFSYPTRSQVQVLNKFNLTIEAGKTVALVGNSGCGKSTIISLLERFYLLTEGQILIDGNDINNINVRYLRSQMGLVSQEPVLFDTTIKENIIYGLEEEVTMDKIIEAAKIANIHNFIMKLPQTYDTSVGERGSKLSGGQKQRIAIARAVLRNPKILLLDEATSALDIENEKVVQEALENASIGRTNIVIAHRLSTIRKADKIVVIQNGEVIEEGNHEQLMEKKGYYFKLLNR